MLIGISGKKSCGKDTVGEIINILTTFPKMSTDTIKNNLLKGKKFAHPVYVNKKFANKLKDIVCLLIGCTREQLEDEEFKNIKLSAEWSKYEVVLINPGASFNYFKTLDFNSRKEAEDFLSTCSEYELTDLVEIKLTPRLLMQLIGTECGREILHPNIWVNSLMSEYKPDSKWYITDVRFPNEANVIKDKGGILIRVERDTGLVEEEEDGFEDIHESEIALDDFTDWDYVISNNGPLESLIEIVRIILTEKQII